MSDYLRLQRRREASSFLTCLPAFPGAMVPSAPGARLPGGLGGGIFHKPELKLSPTPALRPQYSLIQVSPLWLVCGSLLHIQLFHSRAWLEDAFCAICVSVLQIVLSAFQKSSECFSLCFTSCFCLLVWFLSTSESEILYLSLYNTFLFKFFLVFKIHMLPCPLTSRLSA